QPGQQGNQPGQQGNQPGQQGNQPGQPGGNPNGGGAPGGEMNPGGSGEAPSITPEAADLENRKRSTDLALKRLQEQLERGDTPKELMDQLGFTEQDLNQFMQRLEQRLADSGADHSPEAESARRQFDSLLKGADYDSKGARRDGGDGPRNASESFGAANRPVPPEYRKDVEAYKKKVSE
ncbi:MAG: hypothetical protein KDA90_15150, partial [Planctomycetaceae bacterium]|nr:hypothetical protein [Planctomycetaceae bacterium]